MYFLFFKLHSWGKRFGSSRRRFIQRFLSGKKPYLSVRQIRFFVYQPMMVPSGLNRGSFSR